MILRPYIPSDFSALYRVEELSFVPPLRFDRRYMRRLVKKSKAAVWVAEVDGQIVGFAIAERSRSREQTVAYIQTIEVLSDFRGRGIATQLLMHIEETVRQAGASILWLHVDSTNSSAVRLYQSQGYVALGREENFYPQGNAAIAFRKQLKPRGL